MYKFIAFTVEFITFSTIRKTAFYKILLPLPAYVDTLPTVFFFTINYGIYTSLFIINNYL